MKDIIKRIEENQALSVHDRANIKKELFVKEYIKNGFNGTQAYIAVYNTDNDVTAKTEASVLLRNPNVIKLLVKELKKIDFTSAVKSEQFVVFKALEMIDGSCNDSVKARLLDLIAKIGDLYSENAPQVAVFAGVDGKEQAIMARRFKDGAQDTVDVSDETPVQDNSEPQDVVFGGQFESANQSQNSDSVDTQQVMETQKLT